jgi:predicted permease
MVSLLGGLLGLLLTFWLTRLMTALMPGSMVPNESRIQVNAYVLLFCATVSVITGIMFGLAPALQLSRPETVESLKDEGRSSRAVLGVRTRTTLVVAEVALAMVLLVSAGLTFRSFLALKQVELGFRPENVMNVEVNLPPKQYPNWDQRNRFALELLDRVRSIPGVQGATIGFGGIPFGGPELAYSLEGQTDPQVRRIKVLECSGDFLTTLRIPLRRGRMLTEQDINRAEPVAVINETAAKLWPAEQDPIGRRIHLDDLEKPPPFLLTSPSFTPDVTIVGVVADARNDDLQSKTQPAVLIPFTLLAPAQRTLTIRTLSDPTALVNAVRAQLRQLAPEVPLNSPRALEEIVNAQTAQPRFVTLLFTFFGVLGLALAMAGIYSVLSYAVSRRTREIGVRIALGAQRGDVLRLILKTGANLVGLGIVLGLVASFAATRLLASQLELFQIKSTDPVSFLAVMVLLSFVATMACLIPARRATAIDPMNALRHE